MAWSMIQKPGATFGPCAKPCKHTDCADLRTRAATDCAICTDPIGYEVAWAKDAKDRICHWNCIMDQADAEASDAR